MNPSNTCCFIGHRTINETKELKYRLRETIEYLINNQNIDTFLYGSRSEFDRLCLEMVTELKEKYPHVKRIYVRAEFPNIDDNYRSYLLKSYDDTYYPQKIVGARRAVYIERNCEIIQKSRICVIYYDELLATSRKSGTKLALDHARRQNKEIILFP